MAANRQALDEIDAGAWVDACRRDDVVRALLANAGAGPIGRSQVATAAHALEISTATLYHIIARFRETRLKPASKKQP